MSVKSSSMHKAAVAAATALTLVSANLPSAPAKAEPATRSLSLSKAPEPITKKECLNILAEFSRTVGTILYQKETDKEFRDVPWDDVFPRSLARFVAPRNPDPIYETIIKGNFMQVFDPDTKEGLEWIKKNYSSITCDGDKNIITPTGLPVVSMVSIDTSLSLRSHPIYLKDKGVNFVSPQASFK